ncbi:hypothetical protein PtA15_4A679 [Puccinia triticina]|uniref:Uncharacterized protein n=1 Tax=Puccinia triticina TaxID=208348 RepID=A0ABY7CJT3_9BASI|nr:uncharacterized protein PtA15_4A679 [Puccinia triticina]WAQ84227.1 hypothetical protein PtA15_4A679 [Puccinia triticina]
MVVSQTLQDNLISLEVKYNFWLCDETLQLAAPEQIPAEWPCDPSSFMQITKQCCRCVWFKNAVLSHLDLTRDNFKLGGILKKEDALGRLAWVGQIIKPTGRIRTYPLPAGYPIFRRSMLHMPKGARAAVRIKASNAYLETFQPQVCDGCSHSA